MADRRRVAGVLVVLGAALAVVASFQRTFSSEYRGFGSVLTITTTLWTTTAEPVSGIREQPAYFAAGWPVVISALVMVAAVALVLRERTAFVGRPLAVGGAGLLAGVVLFYVVQVGSLAERRVEGPEEMIHYHAGIYLLVVAAIIGLVGAGLAQQRDARVTDDDEGDEVVVHRLDADEDTPPFGIAIAEDERQQEKR